MDLEVCLGVRENGCLQPGLLRSQGTETRVECALCLPFLQLWADGALPASPPTPQGCHTHSPWERSFGSMLRETEEARMWLRVSAVGRVHWEGTAV